jgi:metal-responsive CopG/Arc/MetJ family transcriptional regulator
LKAVNRSGLKNVTLSLPETLLRRFRVYAASRNQSIASLIAEAMREIMDRDANSVKAKRRFLDRIERAPDRGTGGVIRWSREDLHER